MNHSGGANRSNRGLCVLQVTTGIHSCVLRHIRSSALRHIGELQDTGRWRGFSMANVVRRYPPAHVSICSLVNAWRHYVFTQSSSRPHLFNCASTIAVHTVGVELVGLFVDVTSPMPWTARSTGTDGAGIHVLVLAYGVRVWQLQYSNNCSDVNVQRKWHVEVLRHAISFCRTSLTIQHQEMSTVEGQTVTNWFTTK